MKLTLVSKKQLFPDVITFNFQPETPIEWKPGQYFHYILNHENQDDRGTERWFTISSAPFEKNIAITTRIAKENGSSFKWALNSLEIGGIIEGDGPEGDFVVEDFSKHYVFIAGGIGITPFRSMFAQFAHNNQHLNCTLLYANRSDEFVFDEEIQKFADNQNNFSYLKFRDKIAPEEIKAVSGNLNSNVFYISGPKPMVEYYQELLNSTGVESENIKLDDFPGYDGI